MLRAALFYLSTAPWARNTVTRRALARRVASRFVAGETFEAARDAVRALNGQGLYATLDHLGENVAHSEAARAAREHYHEIVGRIGESGLASNLSVKLTQLGLRISTEVCRDHMRAIAQFAQSLANFVRIDMEDSAVVEDTLRICTGLRQEGLTNVGVAIQSYLYRSQADTQRLLDAGIPIRLVKGAYREPPQVAYQRKLDVDLSFDRLAERMIEAAFAQGSRPASPDGKFPPLAAIATHDARRIQKAKEHAARIGLPRQALEFQMLFGIRSRLQLALRAEGYPVRVYVPYGSEWYPYFMRRLAERPANLWFFLTQLFRR